MNQFKNIGGSTGDFTLNDGDTNIRNQTLDSISTQILEGANNLRIQTA